jgi:hypothetical protein
VVEEDGLARPFRLSDELSSLNGTKNVSFWVKPIRIKDKVISEIEAIKVLPENNTVKRRPGLYMMALDFFFISKFTHLNMGERLIIYL